MRIRFTHSLATMSLLFAGLIALPGCNAENPDGTKTKLGEMEEKAEKGLKKAGEVVEKDAKIVGEKLKDGAAATGKAIEHAGEKLETDGKAAVEKNLGETAGKVTEKTGEVLDKTGEKIQEAVKPKD